MELVQNLFLLNYCLFGGLVFVDFFLGGGLGGINIFFCKYHNKANTNQSNGPFEKRANPQRKISQCTTSNRL